LPVAFVLELLSTPNLDRHPLYRVLVHSFGSDHHFISEQRQVWCFSDLVLSVRAAGSVTGRSASRSWLGRPWRCSCCEHVDDSLCSGCSTSRLCWQPGMWIAIQVGMRLSWDTDALCLCAETWIVNSPSKNVVIGS